MLFNEIAAPANITNKKKQQGSVPARRPKAHSAVNGSEDEESEFSSEEEESESLGTST